MKHTIHVTKEHIEHGERMNCARCPIALALRDKFGITYQNKNNEIGFPIVDGAQITFHPYNGENVLLPLRAMQFIACFDSACKMHRDLVDPLTGYPFPFSFEIETDRVPIS